MAAAVKGGLRRKLLPALPSLTLVFNVGSAPNRMICFVKTMLLVSAAFIREVTPWGKREGGREDIKGVDFVVASTVHCTCSV